jgi:hypothetical protein
MPGGTDEALWQAFQAGSIGDVAGFDVASFGISPRDAAQMDPPQRVLLEMPSEAFKQAGIPFIDVRQPLRRLCGSVERRLCLPPHRIDGIHAGGAGTQAHEYPKTDERPE